MNESGGFVHRTDPFAVPEDERSPVRRLRGRLPAAVTLWTAPGRMAGEWVGLTISSTLVVDGEPGRVLGLVDEESDLWAAVRAGGVFAVAPLRAVDRRLADRFAGLMPAPGGPFTGYEWRETAYGPVLAELGTWAGCRLDDARSMGWGLLISAIVENVEIGADDEDPLVYYRGGYQ